MVSVLFRWLFRLCWVGVVGAFLFLGFSYYFVSRSLPDYNVERVVSGVSAPVEIVRDTANVPHTVTDVDVDSVFALGYAHAQDRLWQMTLLRRTAQGRLSELFGAKAIQTDIMMRSLDIYHAAQSSVSGQDPKALDALKAYSAGVNAWLLEVQTNALGRGAPEMWLFNHPIAPWTPADSLAVLKLMAVQNSSHLEREVLRARLSLAVGVDRMRELLPNPPREGITELPDYASMMKLPRGSFARAMQPEFSVINAPVFAGASNMWAVSSKRSATRATLLANDPHLTFSAPGVWYLARLQLGGDGVIGATIPGIPLIMSGRNSQIAWGVTASYVDDQDLYIEELHEDDPEQYRTLDGWEKLQRKPSIIFVKDAPSVTVNVSSTENGVVLPKEAFRVESLIPNGHVMALSSTALNKRDVSFSAAFDLMFTRSREQAFSVLPRYSAPSQNITVIDKTSIGMMTVGALPKRDVRHQSQGLYPSYGYLAENRWQGMLSPEHRPVFVDPQGGILGNTNNKMIDRPFPYHMSFEWGDTQRVLRWQRLMQERKLHTRDSFIEAQQDITSFTARSLLPLVAANLFFTQDTAVEGSHQAARKTALSLLGSWNGEMSEHLPEPLIYSAWMLALQDRLIRDELGPLADEFTHVQPLFIERVFRDIEGASKWCDIVQSAGVESCAQIADQALDDAVIWISQTYGPALETLRWGDAHRAMHHHSVLGNIPFLDWLVNVEHPSSGGDHTLQRGLSSGAPHAPFQNVHGAGYRGIYNLSDPDSSLFVTSTGQSGHPFSRFYDSFSRLWRQGEYIPMSLDLSLARAASVGVTSLTPASSTGNP